MIEETPHEVYYTYDELTAIRQIRKSMRKKPEIIAKIMEGASREMASRVLIQAKTELGQLLEVSRAFSAAAGVLAKQPKESNHEDK